MSKEKKKTELKKEKDDYHKGWWAAAEAFSSLKPMSRRDQFAMAAMQGAIVGYGSIPTHDMDRETLAVDAVGMADTTIAELGKGKTEGFECGFTVADCSTGRQEAEIAVPILRKRKLAKKKADDQSQAAEQEEQEEVGK